MSESMTFTYSQRDEEGQLIKTVEIHVPESGVLVNVLEAFRDLLRSSGFEYVLDVAADCGDFVHSSADPYSEFVEEIWDEAADEVADEDYDVGA